MSGDRVSVHPAHIAQRGDLDSEGMNRPAWPCYDPRKGHYEVWYLTWVDPDSGQGAWIRFTLDIPSVSNRKDESQVSVWCSFFDRQNPSRTGSWKADYPLEDFSFEDNPFRVKISDSELRMNGTSGNLEPEGGPPVQWELEWGTASTHPFLHLPPPLYRGFFPRTKVLSPHLDLQINGFLRIGDQRVELREVPGGQTHLWGTCHAWKWTWGHVNHFTDGGVGVFEGLTGQVALGPFRSWPLSASSLRLEEKQYAFNTWYSALRNRGRPGPLPEWEFCARSRTHRLEGCFRAKKEDTVLVEYRDPDGRRLWCANSEIATAHMTLSERVGHSWEERARLVADGTAAVEFAGDDVSQVYGLWT